jgi:1,4-alpha-glucan branching enzyme
VRRGVGIKYYRVTGEGARPEGVLGSRRARERAGLHAHHFLAAAPSSNARGCGPDDRPPIVVSPYDSELFGHWWFEGPWFIESFLRQAAGDPRIETVTATDYLDRHPRVQEQEPCPSTWGAEGYSTVWLNGANAGIYRHLHHAERRMERLLERHPDAAGAAKEALDQAARELLLAQSSDWAFIVTHGTSVPYAAVKAGARAPPSLPRARRRARGGCGRSGPGGAAQGARRDLPLARLSSVRVSPQPSGQGSEA